MAEATPKNFIEYLRPQVERELKRVIEDRYNQMKKDFDEKIEREKDQAIAGIAITLMSQVEFKEMGNILTIRVITDAKKNN